jgi:hypothetical protein
MGISFKGGVVPVGTFKINAANRATAIGWTTGVGMGNARTTGGNGKVIINWG